VPAPNWDVFVPSADNEQNRWRQTTTLFGQHERRFLTQLIIDLSPMSSGANGREYTRHGALIQNLNPVYTQKTDRDLLRTVPSIGPAISRSSPIIHLILPTWRRL
jgi:hypothetical protein